MGNTVRAGFKDADGRHRKVADKRRNKEIERAVQKGAGAVMDAGLASRVEEGMERGLGKALLGGGADREAKGELVKSLEMYAKESAKSTAREAVVGM